LNSNLKERLRVEKVELKTAQKGNRYLLLRAADGRAFFVFNKKIIKSLRENWKLKKLKDGTVVFPKGKAGDAVIEYKVVSGFNRIVGLEKAVLVDKNFLRNQLQPDLSGVENAIDELKSYNRQKFLDIQKQIVMLENQVTEIHGLLKRLTQLIIDMQEKKKPKKVEEESISVQWPQDKWPETPNRSD